MHKGLESSMTREPIRLEGSKQVEEEEEQEANHSLEALAFSLS